jgi:DNA-binding transcriptional regulator PaaX
MSSKHAGARAGKEILYTILSLIEEGKMPEPMHRDKLAYLKRYGYITRTECHTLLTPKGGYTLSEAKIWNLTISTPKKWSRKWYLVAFDIPHDKRKRRDAFRLRLKELGLKRYQNSVWIYPHPLKDTVKTIASFYALSKCVSFIVAEEISGEVALRKHFKLSL